MNTEPENAFWEDHYAMPKRIQLRRTKGWRKPEGAVVVSRPSGWGNPFKIGEPYRFLDAGEPRIGVTTTRAQAVELFRAYMRNRTDMWDQIRTELGGRDLCCWCPPDQPCHADVLLELANSTPQRRP